jgi:hypothetical protein
MKIKEIREIAAQRGLKAGTMKKTDLIRSIQRAEGNNDCFASERAAECMEERCLWRADCA